MPLDNLKPTYFRQLTGIRAVAAYMVFAFHYVYIYRGVLSPVLSCMAGELHVGVTVFFVLSGFLIAYRYVDKIEVSRAWLFQYCKNRVARIYPMYFILTSVVFLYYRKMPAFSWRLYLINITFLKGLLNDSKFTGISSGWSLTVEECFYVLAPIIFILRKKINLWLMPLAILAVGAALAVIFRDRDFYGFLGTPSFVFKYTFFGHCVAFFVGIQLALIIRSGQVAQKPGFAFTFLGIAGMVVCLYMLTWFPFSEMFNRDVLATLIICSAVLPVFISLLFYGLITETTKLRIFLSSPLMVLLGESSYIFYLLHEGFFYELTSIAIPLSKLGLVVYFIFTNIVSVLLYKLIEHPVNNYIRKHFNKGLFFRSRQSSKTTT